MSTISLRKKMKSGSLLLGLSLMYPSPGVVEEIGSDWDWVWIDGQHGEFSYESILACVRACDHVGTAPIVRVPSHDYGTIGLALDMCAAGVMVPMVDSAKEAKTIVQAAKYSPLGRRSFGGRRTIDLYGRGYAHTANEDTLLIAQIETKEALSNVEEIAAVPGVDVLFFSPDDMAMQEAMPMDKPRKPDVFRDAMARLVSATANAGKLAGTVTPSPELLKIATGMGYQMCTVTGDVSLLLNGSKNKREQINSVIKNMEGTVSNPSSSSMY